MNRIAIVGTTGSGKTTLASQLAGRLNCPHVELDALYWAADWQAVALPLFRERVESCVQGARWVVDGNYSKVRDITWGRADTIVWLDYALPLVMWRLVARSVSRVAKRQELWNGNREDLKSLLMSRDSLLLWAVTSHRQQQKEYPELLGQVPKDRSIVRHRTPRETNKWLATIQQS